MVSANVRFIRIQTPLELLEALKTVDGAGSGLDADLLDGLHANQIGGGGGLILVQETLVVSGGGVPAALSFPANPATSLRINVNGILAEQTVDYTIVGSTVTWIATSYSLDPADTVIAVYFK